MDVPGQRKQKEVRVALGYCRDKMDAMLKLQEESGKAGVLNLDKVRECISPTTKFRDQAAWWINEMSEGQILHAKKREPIDPNTIHSYQNAAAYLNDQIGDVPLASIDNPQAKTIITKMKSEQRKDGQRRFSDKTIVEYFRVLRRVIASVLDENFNSIHHRSWNLAAIGLPRVNLKKQRRPTLTAKEMTTLLSKAEGQYQILYFFCMVTGMRVSEAVAVEIGKHIETDCSIVYVRQQREKSKNCVKAHLKTESGCRDVDIHPNAAAILRNFIGNRKDGFLFQTEDGRMFDPRSIARANLEPIFEAMGRGEAGTMFNVFRRFREAVLQRSDARQLLIDYWMGHSNASIGDRYGKQLVEDIEYRQEQVKQVGLGFELPPSLFGLHGLQIVENVEAA
jgi:integrase